MRVPFIAPLPHHFDDVFALQSIRDIKGGGLNDIRIYQKRGGSLFGILGGLFKRAIPFLKSILLPEIGNFVRNVTHDISQKVPSRESLKTNLLSSAKNIGSRIVRGGGKRKIVKSNLKRKNIKQSTSKKNKKKKKKGHCVMKQKKDIFNSGKYEL